MYKKKKLSVVTKTYLVLMAFILLVGSFIGTTTAWMMSESDTLMNTFTYGDINIDLEETDTDLDEDEDEDTNTYKMMPGEILIKDPRVIVKQGSEDCWLFVEIKEINDVDLYMDYNILIREENEWLPLNGYPGVYYREVDASEVKDADKVFEVIENNQVKVKEDITKEQLNTLTEKNYPKIEIKAYAVQRNSVISAIDTAAKAWALVSHNG